MSDEPIFILGTERSGSNLLRLILNSHPRVAVPHPPHVVRYFTPLLPAYGDLSDDRAFRRLVDDILRLVAVHVHPWDLSIDAARLVAEARPRDAFGVTTALYEQYREARGKARWACKSTFMVDHVPAILARFPGAKLVLLVRDPRDVAVSSRDSVFSTFHPLHTARLWRDQQAVALGWVDQLPASTIRVSYYERLVQEPEAEVRALCEFIGEDFHPEMLRFFETADARQSGALAESWKRTAEPIRGDTVARWRGQLSDDEVCWVEDTASAPMTRLGYALTHDEGALAASRPGTARRAWIALIEHALHLRVEWRSLRRDQNVGRRWARAALLWRLRVGAGLGLVG